MANPEKIADLPFFFERRSLFGRKSVPARSPIFPVGFSNDGSRVAAVSGSSVYSVWDVATQAILAKGEIDRGHHEMLCPAMIAEDQIVFARKVFRGGRIVQRPCAEIVVLPLEENGETVLGSVQQGSSESFYWSRLHDCGRSFSYKSDEATVIIEVESGRKHRIGAAVKGKHRASDLTIEGQFVVSPSGRFVAYLLYYGAPRVFVTEVDTRNTIEVPVDQVHHKSAFQFLPDERFGFLSDSKQIELVDIQLQQTLWRVKGLKASFGKLADIEHPAGRGTDHLFSFSPNGEWFITHCRKGAVLCPMVFDHAPDPIALFDSRSTSTASCFSPTGDHVAIGEAGGNVSLWRF